MGSVLGMAVATDGLSHDNPHQIAVGKIVGVEFQADVDRQPGSAVGPIEKQRAGRDARGARLLGIIHNLAKDLQRTLTVLKGGDAKRALDFIFRAWRPTGAFSLPTVGRSISTRHFRVPSDG
jgi:hypothetical protein